MTRTKAWRLSLAAILGFGWLFLTPAYSDDPLGTARQQIDQLEADVQKLNDKTLTQTKIDIANSKYDSATVAKSDMDSKKLIMETKQSEYDNSVSALATALSEKNTAQAQVDSQTTIVATADTNKQNKKLALDVANINLTNATNAIQSATQNGVAFQIYPLLRNGNYAYPGSGVMCQGAIPYFYAYDGYGGICGLTENIVGKFTATLTVPAGINDVYFAVYSDDGSRLYVDRNLEAEQWVEQGGTWGPYTRHFDTSVDKTLQLEVWWYNGGGPGVMTVGWGYNGIWTGIPTQYLSYGSGATQQQINDYNAAVSAQVSAQSQYNTALSTYNTENSKLTQYNQTLSSKTTAYNTALTNKNTAQTSLTTATTNYNNSVTAYNTALSELNDAIIDAQNEYNNQWNLEEQQRVQAAIAQALANQPQPTPEPTVVPSVEPSPESSPEPSPEQTKPTDPTPEPSSNTTDEPKPTQTPEPEPTVAPSPEPSSQSTDTIQDPTPEPTVGPSQTPDKTINSPVDEQTANLIADLTNSNTLTKLSPEQKAAVAQALGIKATEIAKVAEIAKTNESVGKALEQFGDRANANLNAPMPYTLADATTEVQAETLLKDPIGALTNIDLTKVFNPSEWGKDMTDDQREKAQEVVVPVIIASNLVAAAMTRRI